MDVRLIFVHMVKILRKLHATASKTMQEIVARLKYVKIGGKIFRCHVQCKVVQETLIIRSVAQDVRRPVRTLHVMVMMHQELAAFVMREW